MGGLRIVQSCWFVPLALVAFCGGGSGIATLRNNTIAIRLLGWVQDLSYPELATVEGEGWKVGRFSSDTGNRNDYLAFRIIRFDGSETKLRKFYGEPLQRHFESEMSKPPLSLQRFSSDDWLNPTPRVIRKIVAETDMEDRESLFIVYSIVMGDDDPIWDWRGR